jgi:hypothetical protein
MTAGFKEPPPGITFAETDLSADVAKVKVRFRGKRRVRTGDTVVAQVNAQLAAQLHQPTAFGYFISFVRGCAFKQVRARALDEHGKLLGTSKGGTPGCPS